MVRRFLNKVEESVKKSTAIAVFEPNDARCGTKVWAMVNSFLIVALPQSLLPAFNFSSVPRLILCEPAL